MLDRQLLEQGIRDVYPDALFMWERDILFINRPGRTPTILSFGVETNLEHKEIMARVLDFLGREPQGSGSS